MPGDQSMKDIVEKVAGKEPDPVVYKFRRRNKKYKGFTEPADQTGHGVYGLTGEDNIWPPVE
jgi:hypothetical protein